MAPQRPDDFLMQLREMKKMGPLENLVGLLPGGSEMVKGADLSKSEREFRRMEGILCAMMPGERATPQILNGDQPDRGGLPHPAPGPLFLL